MKTIRFTEKQPPYMAGDVAGFEDDVADRYVAEGVAEPVSGSSTGGEPAPEDDGPPRRLRRRRRESV